MEFHRPQDACWLCTGCADVCTTAASLLLIVSLAQAGHAGHQLDISISGGSFKVPGQENTTLTLVLFLLCFHLPYSKARALSCYGLDGFRDVKATISFLKKLLSSVCVEGMEPHSYVVKSMVQEGSKMR